MLRTPDPDLEYQYNNMARRPDAPALLHSWSERSAAYRARADAVLDQAYGAGARETLDIFRSGRSDAPLLVYLHGGYWQRGDKNIYSFVAAAYNASGIDVAVVGYPLCPQVSMSRLGDCIIDALGWLYRNADSLGLNRERINLAGHSAGGHLAAMALCIDWPSHGDELPPDLIKTAIPLSGLYQLEPLLATTISDALDLSADEVERLSPMRLEPRSTAPVLAVVGGGETAEFFRQADALAVAWSTSATTVERYDEPEVDHFDLVERLAEPDSELFRRVCAWLT